MRERAQVVSGLGGRNDGDVATTGGVQAGQRGDRLVEDFLAQRRGRRRAEHAGELRRDRAAAAGAHPRAQHEPRRRADDVDERGAELGGEEVAHLPPARLAAEVGGADRDRADLEAGGQRD